MRRYGDRPARGQRYVLRPGVYAVLPKGDGVLLTVQAGLDPQLELPGGGVDPGEQPVRALHREVLEETGWTIARPRRMGAFRRFVWMPEYRIWAEKVCTIYLAMPVRPVGPPLEAEHLPVVLPLREAAEVLDKQCSGAFVKALAR